MAELKPCPFCEGEAETVSSRVAEDATETRAYCKSCGARTEGIEAAYSEHEAAASDWNTRPLEFQLLQEQERAEKDDLRILNARLNQEQEMTEKLKKALSKINVGFEYKRDSFNYECNACKMRAFEPGHINHLQLCPARIRDEALKEPEAKSG